MATNNAVNVGIVAGGGQTYTFPAASGTLLAASDIGVSIQAYDADLTSWGGISRASGFDTFVATPSSANLRALLTDETGTGIAYFVGGALGTPSSATLTNATGLPVSGITASTSTALGVGSLNIGHASDTTVARSAAGQLTIEGVQILTATNTVTVTNKRPQPRTSSSTSNATLTPDLSVAHKFFRTTQTTGLTIAAPTGTPVIGETIEIRVSAAGAQTLTMNAAFIAFGAAFPASLTAGKDLLITASYNGTNWATLWAVAV